MKTANIITRAGIGGVEGVGGFDSEGAGGVGLEIGAALFLDS